MDIDFSISFIRPNEMIGLGIEGKRHQQRTLLSACHRHTALTKKHLLDNLALIRTRSRRTVQVDRIEKKVPAGRR